MISSGTTAATTSSDAAITLLTNTMNLGLAVTRLTTNATSSAACFVSIDSGRTWAFVPAGWAVAEFPGPANGEAVQVKRVAGGSDVTGIFACAF